MRKSFTWLLAIAIVGLWLSWPRLHALSPTTSPVAPLASADTFAKNAPQAAPSLPSFLPAEAHTTIALIQRGGPFPHRQDGSVFGNFERLLPQQPRGWYREYTVETPGLSHRGARRIVTGGNPPREWYYSGDHYRSFRAFDVQGTSP